MFRLTVSFGLVTGLGVLAGGIAGGLAGTSPCVAAPDGAEDPVADWDKRWDKTLADAAAEYGKIVKKYSEKLEATSAFTRWRMLRYLPNDEENRKFLGYIKAKQSDGTDAWERSDIRRDQLKEMSDLDDPKATKYNKDLADADKKVQTWFKGLAKKATENGAAKDASAQSNWTEKAAKAWDRLLEVDDSPGNKDAEEAHKALNHPKAEGKYVTPFKLKFIQARNDRKKIGAKEAAATIKPVDPVEPDGVFVSSGLKGGGAKSTHALINATHGKDEALRLVASCEKGINDTIEIYGFPDTLKERFGVAKLNCVKDEAEFRQILEKGANWKPAKVTKYIDAHFGGVGLENGTDERVLTTSGGASGDDHCMNVSAWRCSTICQGMARADLGVSVQGGIEDWLWQSIGADVTKRVLGTALTHWGAFGRYGETVDARPGEDKWVELARRLVQTDDDEPLAHLIKCSNENQDFKGPQLIKGWAFLQFVFEKDSAKAKKFVWHALAEGTAAAVAAIYPDNVDSPDPIKSMEKIDAEYREWITKGW